MHTALLLLSAAAAFILPRPQRHLQCRAAPEDELPIYEHDYARSAEAGGDFTAADIEDIDELLALRTLAKKDRDYPIADKLRAELVEVYDVHVDDGLRQWRLGPFPPQRPA